MRRWFLVVLLLLLTAGLTLVPAQAQYSAQGTVNFTSGGSKLTAVDPMVYAVNTDVMPARPFLYTVDKNGITITRFNDNAFVGYWSWPKDVIYTVTPNGGYTGLVPPAEWEPVAMTVSYPTLTEWANRGMTGTTVAKPIPDLTPAPTFVYVVMKRSGYEWKSNSLTHRDSIVQATSTDTDSSMLIQIDVSDPSFSASLDPANPVTPHLAAALLGHAAGQPVYDRATGNVYLGNMPSTSLPTALSSFVSVIRRIPDTVAESEAEVPGISIPVIRCGPQHPESGIPVGRPQAYACYDPGGVHPLNDNEHVGAYGNFDWEFRKLPSWLKVGNAIDCATRLPIPADAPPPAPDAVQCSKDGILYGTPMATGESFAEARVHNLDDEYGVFSFWTPIQLLVTPTAEYLPIKAEFAAGVPVAYPLEGSGSCALVGAPAWVKAVPVPNGCVVMAKAALDGEYYRFTMPGFTVNGYPELTPLTFSGNVFGEYGFVPMPTANLGLSGLAWHQISKVADPSTETPVLTAEFIGVEPSSGQLYRILPPPGKPQPPNDRPPETVLALHEVSTEGAALNTLLPPGAAFGEVAVEADRDIFVAATGPTGALIKVSKDTGARSVINLAGLQPYSLSLDSDLRTAIPGLEDGQVDHGALWVTGSGQAAVIDTGAGTVSQTFAVADAGGVTVDFGTRYVYVAADSAPGSVSIFAPTDNSTGLPRSRPLFAPRIWSAEEFTWNQGETAEVKLMATGDAVPGLSLLGELPVGLTFSNIGDGTATISGTPTAAGGDYAMALTATSANGTYAQAFGITVQSPPQITSGDTATFYVNSTNSFTVMGTGWPQPIFYVWDATLLPPGVQLIDNENGTSSLIGTPPPEAAGNTYQFTIFATTGHEPDAQQLFTLHVEAAPAGGMAPVITSANTFTWDAAGAPYSPDPFTVTSIGSPTPTLTIEGTLPPGVGWVDNHDSTLTFGGGCRVPFPGWPAECLGFLPADSVGTWTFTIRASNGVGLDATQIFTLVVEDDPTILNASPATLSFPSDGILQPSQTVSLTTGSLGGGATLPYALVTTATWLTATPVSGWTGGNIEVSANAAGLDAGTYTGTIIVNSAGTEGPPATIAVTLTVLGSSAPGMMGAWPSALKFDYNATQGTIPPPQMVWLMSGGKTLNYKVSTDAKWLSATPADGITPGGFRVSVDPKVGVGMHIAKLTIAAEGAENGPLTVPVTLVKTAGDSDLAQVMFDVGGGPEGIAINRNTHNLFITSSNVAAEAGSEAAAESGAAETEVPGPPEPSVVFQINPLNKTVVGEFIVHSEGEYVGVNSKTGLAYHASQGTGEVAVIDAANNKVAFIPLIGKSYDGLREGAFQPYQIAIDEAQNLIYVGAKAPPIVDPPSPTSGCMAIHEMPDDEYDCWNPGKVFVIDGETNQVVGSFFAGDDPEGVMFAAATWKVYASNEDDGSITVAKGAVRNANGSITAPVVLSTIIKGKPVAGWWKPTCDANNYCGERGQAALWPKLSACNGKDDEAEEADKMAVDPAGNVYVIDDRYRVAKIDGKTDTVLAVLEIPGYDCELEVPDGSEVLFRNSANNIAYMPLGQGKLYVTSEQNTITLIDPRIDKTTKNMTIKSTLTIPGAVELDAITTDPGLNMVFITDEGQASLWILKGACANGTGNACVIKQK